MKDLSLISSFLKEGNKTPFSKKLYLNEHICYQHQCFMYETVVQLLKCFIHSFVHSLFKLTLTIILTLLKLTKF